MLRKWMGMILSVCMVLSLLVVPVSADELPQAFWALNDAYLAAKDAGDDDGIINFGEQVVSLLTSVPETQQIKEILASRYYDIADAYERKGNFERAGEYYAVYIPYGEFMNWEDGVRIAKSKCLQYPSTVTGYTTAVQPQKDFGARNEPDMGVLYGQVAEETKNEESMLLLYIDYGTMPNDWALSILDKARERNVAVEIGWNIQGEGGALADIPNQTAYITEFLQVLNQYSDIPMYLRIGAEMNVWQIPADPEQFKQAFRVIADLVHAQTSHVATVWSVAHASAWNVDMLDFYPGDEYVDWVGISAYMIRYFEGREWSENERLNEVSFCAGDGADPVMLVRETVEKFGDRKPIMLAECGSAHTTTTLSREHSDWAVNHLKRMYWFVPMVYPQVKLMAYFNTYIEPESNDYALTHSPALEQAYTEATKAPHFIQDHYATAASQTYRPLQNGMILPQAVVPLYAYPHVYGDDNPSVRYYIDGNLAGEISDIPYQFSMDLSGYGIGEHSIRLETVSQGRVAASAEYAVTVAENIRVTVNGEELRSDVVPVMENDRVLVPMRTIFEALGASVNWDDASQTAIASKNGIEIAIGIDQNQMRKNGESISLDVPARLINDRTMVPVRAVSEALDAQVDWNDAEKTVVIE